MQHFAAVRTDAGEVIASLGKAEVAVRATTYVVSVMIVLAIIVPAADLADVVPTTLWKGDVATAGTRVRSASSTLDDVNEDHAHEDTAARRTLPLDLTDRVAVDTVSSRFPRIAVALQPTKQHADRLLQVNPGNASTYATQGAEPNWSGAVILESCSVGFRTSCSARRG